MILELRTNEDQPLVYRVGTDPRDGHNSAVKEINGHWTPGEMAYIDTYEVIYHSGSVRMFYQHGVQSVLYAPAQDTPPENGGKE